MRVIKFRVWDSRFSKFLKLDGSILMHPESGFLHGSRSSGNVDYWLLQQFTGLLDKNGVEIYEGDVVSVDGSGDCEVKICPYWGVVYVDSDGYERQHADCVSEQDYPTVIGNIHETPELLK